MLLLVVDHTFDSADFGTARHVCCQPAHTPVCVCSVINPLIAPMTLVYFIITGMTAKYSLLYIQRPAYASGGKVRRAAAPAITPFLLPSTAPLLCLLCPC